MPQGIAVVLLFVSFVLAIVIKVRAARAASVAAAATIAAGGTPVPPNARNNWLFVISCVVTFVVMLLVAFAEVPNNGWGVVWILLALVIGAILVSMAIDWPDNEIGVLMHNLTWGFPVEIDPSDPRLDATSPDYDPALVAAMAADPEYVDPTPHFQKWGVLVHHGLAALLIVITLITWLFIALLGGNSSDNGNKNEGAAPSDKTTSAPASQPPTATPATPSAPASSPAAPAGAASKFSCGTPTLDPLRDLHESNLWPVGVQYCVDGQWVAWDKGAKKITATHGAVDEKFQYFTFKLNDKEYLIRVEIVRK